MGCGAPTLATGTLAPMSNRHQSDYGSTNDRWLILSNSPETVNLDEGAISWLYYNLYKTSIEVPSTGILKFRLYFWHVNGTSAASLTYQLRLSIAESGSNGTITAHTAVTPATQDFVQTGICLADAQLFGTLDGATSGQTIVGGGQRSRSTLAQRHREHCSAQSTN